MRKIYYLAMALITATMAGCQKENELLDIKTTNQTFYATFENGVSSRTTLDESNNVLWSEGDRISVFGGNTANNAFILDEGANTTFGKFEMNSATAGTETDGSTTALSANVAYYPYDGNVTVTESNGAYTFNATFPATQTYSASGTFGPGASPMVAVTSGTLDANLKFKNVGAIFRLQLKGTATITRVAFSADASLAGNCAITASNTEAPTVNVTKGYNTIVLDCGEGVQLNNNTATNFVVAMLPVQNVTGGITITIYDNAGKKMVYKHKEDETISIERSKAYTTAEVTYEGNEDANTPLSVQAALDAAINQNSPTVIQLEPGVNYGTLVFRPSANSRVVDISNIGGNAAGNEKYSKYENITIIGAPGATVDQFDFQAKWIEDITCGSYIDIKNLTVQGVTFSGQKTAFNMDGSKGGWLGIDGLTIDGCTMNDADGQDRFVFQQISGYKQLNDKTTSASVMTTGVKNLTITNCTVTGAYQVIESRAMENLKITNNTFSGIKERDMLITSDATNHPDKTYTGKITITGNTSTGGEERFVRASLNNSSATVTIKNNTITNYKGADADWIKVTDATGTVDIQNNTCSYTVSDVDALKDALAAATDGTIITLAAGSYEGLSFIDPASFKAKNITIVGKEGAKIAGFSVNNWSAESNIEINGLTFKNITFTSGLLLSTKVMSNVTVQDCDFMNDACIHQNDNTEQLTNLVVTGCTFTGDKSGTTTAIMLENTKNVTVTGCTFTNIDFNVLQGGILTGTVLIDNNTINGTGDRVFRFVNTSNVDITISNNTITSDGDDAGELAKSTNAVEITLTGNTWNGQTDAQVATAGKLINITVK